MHVKQRSDICLISDRHQGVIKAVRDGTLGWLPPHGHHRCCLHVVSNFNGKFNNPRLKAMPHHAGCQFQRRKFEKMNNIREIDVNAV